MDLTGARMLARLTDELAKRQVELRLAEVHATTRDLLRADGLDRKLGGIDRFTSLADVIEGFQRESTA
jgi:hypothetical protein